MKTDKQDARRLARLHRMGELTSIRVPTEAEEGVRDLCRAREDAIEDRRRARQRLGGMLLRHGRVYRDAAAWTMKHVAWLEAQRFEDRAVQATHARSGPRVSVRDPDVAAIEADLRPWFDDELFHDRCSRLAAYRGIDRLGASAHGLLRAGADGALLGEPQPPPQARLARNPGGDKATIGDLCLPARRRRPTAHRCPGQ